MPIIREGTDQIPAFETVPISFEVVSRVDICALVERGVVLEVPTEHYRKDYDSHWDDTPTGLASRYDLRDWGIFACIVDGVRVGGIIIAPKTSGYEVLAGHPNAAIIVDIRILPKVRGTGIGRDLVEEARNWAIGSGHTEILVETQDTNVAACRFYSRLGFLIHSVETEGYGSAIKEAQLIWRLPLGVMV